MVRWAVVFTVGMLAAADMAQAANLTLAWDPSVRATGYVLLYGTNSGQYTSQVDVGASTQYQITTLSSGQSYFFAVRAYSSTGQLSGLSNQATGLTALDPITPPPNVGFVGDGRRTLLWQHTGGSLAAWAVDNTLAVAELPISPSAVTDPDWRVVTSTDFNVDGSPDIVFQHRVLGNVTVWFMRGTTMVGAEPVTPSAPYDLNWKLVDATDLNSDGRPDLLWQHAVTGAVAVWHMNGTRLFTASLLSPSGPVDTNWKAVAAVDLNSDSRPDIVWQHAVSGQVSVWYMNGLTMTGADLLSPAGPVDPNWKVVDVVDLNRDGAPDIVWQHELYGGVSTWFLSGTGMTSAAAITPNTSGISWRVIAVR